MLVAWITLTQGGLESPPSISMRIPSAPRELFSSFVVKATEGKHNL
jgi:hypothetical protein